jgi:hypothetical protein
MYELQCSGVLHWVGCCAVETIMGVGGVSMTGAFSKELSGVDTNGKGNIQRCVSDHQGPQLAKVPLEI